MGVKSTYFVLLRTDFYNPASKRTLDMLRQIRDMGHEVGLHFDEVAYQGCSAEELPEWIRVEAALLSEICQSPVRCFSMHRPNRLTLEKGEIDVEGRMDSFSYSEINNYAKSNEPFLTRLFK